MKGSLKWRAQKPGFSHWKRSDISPRFRVMNISVLRPPFFYFRLRMTSPVNSCVTPEIMEADGLFHSCLFEIPRIMSRIV